MLSRIPNFSDNVFDQINLNYKKNS